MKAIIQSLQSLQYRSRTSAYSHACRNLWTRYARAREYFLRVLSLCGDRMLHTWETTLFNLGHTCRKLRLYNEAIDFYMKAQNAQPQNASVSK